ncbi:MAG: hypothetical protein R3C08_04525 [Hyphomonas sp.]
MTEPGPPAAPRDVPAPTTGKPPKRSLLLRLFGISPWGALKLTGLCILVGFFVMAANFNPASPDVDIPAALASIARQAFAATGWAVRNFWKPALAGATIVLPLWVLWRLATLPFRK